MGVVIKLVCKYSNGERLSRNIDFYLLSYGVCIRIRYNNVDVLQYLEPYFPPGYEVSSKSLADVEYSFINEGDYYLLLRNSTVLVQTADLEEALATFDSDLRIQIAVSTAEKLFVHAGVVGWHSKAIVIPGRSFSGKSTLVEALIKAGAIYYSDEYAVLDCDGMVHPYLKPLSLRQQDGSRVKSCPVNAHGTWMKPEPIPLAMVVHTEYQPGEQWNPKQISSGVGLLSMLDNTVVARLNPDFALKTLTKAIERAHCIEGQRGESEETANALLSLVHY